MSNEIQGLWRVSEELGTLADGPAALALVTRTAGELTGAEGAAVALDAGHETVLASTWGTVGLPVGLKRSSLRCALDSGFGSTAAEPVCNGGRPIGYLWIGRATDAAFGADERMTLKALAAMTSLAVGMLRERSRRGAATTVEVPTSVAHEPAPRADLGVTPVSHVDRPPHDPVPIEVLADALPAFPPALVRLVTVLDDSSDAKDVVAALQLDPVLTTLVIRAANSAACGRVRSAATVQEAVLALGARGVRNLAMMQFARGLLSQRGPIETLLWEQSMGTAVRTQMALETLGHSLADRGYLGGLLHNVGMVALHRQYQARYEHVLMKVIVEERPLVEVEHAELGTDGATITQSLLARWSVPSEVLPVLRAPKESSPSRVLDWAEHATLAANPAWRALREQAGMGGDAPWLTARCSRAARQLGLAEDDLTLLEQRSYECTERTRLLVAT